MRAVAYITLLMGMALSVEAFAQDLEPTPEGLSVACGQARCIDDAAFSDLASEMSAMAFSDPTLPAAAGGGESYELHAYGSLLLLPPDSPHLVDGTANAGAVAESVGLLARKGLPFGIAVRAGVNATPRAGLFRLSGGLDLNLLGSRDAHGVLGLATRVSGSAMTSTSSVSGAGLRFEVAAALPLVLASESLLTPIATLGLAWASFSASGVDLTPEIDGGQQCQLGDCSDLESEVEIAARGITRVQLTLAADLRFRSLTLGLGGRFDIVTPFGATDAGPRVAFFARVGIRR